MSTFLNIIKRCWLLYVIGGLILYTQLDRHMLDLQFLNTYRAAATELINCDPLTCSQVTLKKGLTYYTHWIDLFHDSMEANNAVGFCFYHLKDYIHALKYFNRAIELDPQNPSLYYNQGLVFLRLDHFDKAIMALKKGASLFTAQTFLRHGIILPIDKKWDLNDSTQLALVYNLLYSQYQDLISLVQQINYGSDFRQRQMFIEKLHQKINGLELYYYVPIYKGISQGQVVQMI